jgi:hypothetical protein
MSFKRACVLCLLWGWGCRPEPVEARGEPSSGGAVLAASAQPDASGSSAQPDASGAATAERVDPVEAARVRHGMTAAARWPGAGGLDAVIALARSGSAGAPVGALTWARDGESALVEARSYPLSSTSVTALSALDVGGDPGDELLVFGAALNEFSTSVAVFSLPAGREQPLHDGARSAALDGARSLEEVRARLPLERTRTEAERAAQTATAFLGQLVFAPVSDLRAALGASGLIVCRVRAPQGRRRTERCRTFAGRALTDAVIEREGREALRHMYSTMTTMSYSCAAEDGESCTALISGGTEVTAHTADRGAARRLAKITLVDHEIGE